MKRKFQRICIERERNIYIGQAESSGKPKEIIEKMVAGKIKKFIKENTASWPSIRSKDQDLTVREFAKSKGSKRLLALLEWQLETVVERKTEDFAEEVAKQVG